MQHEPEQDVLVTSRCDAVVHPIRVRATFPGDDEEEEGQMHHYEVGRVNVEGGEGSAQELLDANSISLA